MQAQTGQESIHSAYIMPGKNPGAIAVQFSCGVVGIPDSREFGAYISEQGAEITADVLADHKGTVVRIIDISPPPNPDQLRALARAMIDADVPWRGGGLMVVDGRETEPNKRYLDMAGIG